MVTGRELIPSYWVLAELSRLVSKWFWPCRHDSLATGYHPPNRQVPRVEDDRDIPSLKLTPSFKKPIKKTRIESIFHQPLWFYSPEYLTKFTHTPLRIPGQDGAKEEGQVEPVRKDPGLSGMARFHRTNRACFSSKETVVRERNRTPLPPFLGINLSKVQYPFWLDGHWCFTTPLFMTKVMIWMWFSNWVQTPRKRTAGTPVMEVWFKWHSFRTFRGDTLPPTNLVQWKMGQSEFPLNYW